MAITNITGNNNQSGGQTVTPLNWGLFNRQMYSGNTKGLEVTQTTTPSMAVSVSTGLALLDYQTISSVQATILTPKTVAISTANTSNPRIDTVVIYEDTSVTMPTAEPFSADAGNGRFKLRTIDGTPAASPVALSDAAIQSTIGAGMAWTRLADVRVNANVTSIINSNITPRHNELSPWRGGVAFRVRKTNSQIIGAQATIAWDIKSYDLGNNFSSPYFTAPYNGIYSFVASVNSESTATQRTFMGISGTASVNLGGKSSDSDATRQRVRNISFEGYIQAGQTVGIEFYSSTPVDVATSTGTWFAGHLVTRL